jgi:hypothetical protein
MLSPVDVVVVAAALGRGLAVGESFAHAVSSRASAQQAARSDTHHVRSWLRQTPGARCA